MAARMECGKESCAFYRLNSFDKSFENEGSTSGISRKEAPWTTPERSTVEVPTLPLTMATYFLHHIASMSSLVAFVALTAASIATAVAIATIKACFICSALASGKLLLEL
ncbi:hypothetical protein ACSQ67_020850 [Phaseolus vulgaris]